MKTVHNYGYSRYILKNGFEQDNYGNCCSYLRSQFINRSTKTIRMFVPISYLRCKEEDVEKYITYLNEIGFPCKINRRIRKPHKNLELHTNSKKVIVIDIEKSKIVSSYHGLAISQAIRYLYTGMNEDLVKYFIDLVKENPKEDKFKLFIIAHLKSFVNYPMRFSSTFSIVGTIGPLRFFDKKQTIDRLKRGFYINNSIRKSEKDKFVSNVNGFIPVPIVKQVLSQPISTIIKTMF